MSEENLFWVFDNSGTFFELEQSKEDNKFRQTKWVRWNNFHNRVSVVEEKRPYSLFCLEKKAEICSINLVFPVPTGPANKICLPLTK